ncbi:hypothetical protein [Jiangella rhizosphaerae]|uniref:hypothetical protein n=1 Tax=Jiangella rhizosphaerae TaxID=2293569 RepID=UPI00131493AE|nr:hypothetical protein [Jiangella rhizosphaerae]
MPGLLGDECGRRGDVEVIERCAAATARNAPVSAAARGAWPDSGSTATCARM